MKSFFLSLKFSHWAILFYPVFLSMVSRQRYAEEIYSVDRSAMLQIAFTAVLFCYVAARLLSSASILKGYLFKRPMVWLYSYIILAFCSIVWSSRIDYTFYRSLEVFIFLFLIVDAMASLKDFDAMVKFQLCFGFVLALSWHLKFFLQTTDLTILHNSLVSGAVISTAFVGLAVKGKVWRIMYAVILISIVIGTSTATYLSIIAGIGVSILFASGRKKYLGIAIIFGVVIFLFFDPTLADLVLWGKDEKSLYSASGRIPVWKWVYESYVVQKPFLGYGFGQGEGLARLYNVAKGGLRMQHMHNIVLGAVTNLGLAGLTLFFFFILDSFRSALLMKNFKERYLIVGGFAAMMLNALSISSFTSPLSFGWIGHTMFLAMVSVFYINRKNEFSRYIAKRNEASREL